MSLLDGELLRAVGGVALVVLRAWAILQAQVLWRSVVGRWWWAIAAGLAVLVAPVVGAVPVVASWPAWGLAAVAELALGTAIGTLVSLPGHALIGAGTASAAALRVAPRPFVGLFVVVALVAGLGLGLHHPLLEALAVLDARYPVGQPQQWLAVVAQDALPALLDALSSLLVLALGFATPVLLTVVVLDIGTRLVGRGPGASAATVEPIRLWVRFAGAMAALGASWAALTPAWGRVLALP